MFTLYLALILLVSFVVGVAVTSYTLLSALICFTFALPLTKELNESGVLSKNNIIAKRYTSSALFLIVVFAIISFLVYWFGSSVVQIGYVTGFVFVVIKIAFNPKQVGVNKENVSDYMGLDFNRKYFVKVSPGDGAPADDVLTFIFQKVFLDRLNIIVSKMVRTANLDMTHKRWSQDEIRTLATKIFKDAVRIEPETEEGKIARKQAQEYAYEVTQAVRLPRQTPVTEEENEMFRNHPVFGFSEEKKKRQTKDLN